MTKKIETNATKKTPSAPAPPPSRPPRTLPGQAWAGPWPRKMVMVKSITRAEIDRFWRRKKMEEEEHLLAAQKAAARIRAKILKEADYRSFEERLREILNLREGNGSEKNGKDADRTEDGQTTIRIKDWWTRSSYAYLNEPAIESMDENRINCTSTYVLQKICFGFCSPAPYQLSTISFGIF